MEKTDDEILNDMLMTEEMAEDFGIDLEDDWLERDDEAIDMMREREERDSTQEYIESLESVVADYLAVFKMLNLQVLKSTKEVRCPKKYCSNKEEYELLKRCIDRAKEAVEENL